MSDPTTAAVEEVALLPCPFCGSEAEIERRGDHKVSTIYQCTFCGCSLETGEEWSHGRDWNNRAAILALPSVGWRTIDSAPKDGTHFLARGKRPSKNDDTVEIRETHWRFYGDGSPAKAAFDRGKGPSGAFEWSEPIHNWSSSWEPEEWMPMPCSTSVSCELNDPTDAMIDAALAVDWENDGDTRAVAVNVWYAMESARQRDCVRSAR